MCREWFTADRHRGRVLDLCVETDLLATAEDAESKDKQPIMKWGNEASKTYVLKIMNFAYTFLLLHNIVEMRCIILSITIDLRENR